MKRIEFEVINVISPITIDELIEYAWNELPDCNNDVLEFEGETLELGRKPLGKPVYIINDDCIQLIVSALEDGFFQLQAVCEEGVKEVPTLTIPAYLQEQLIAVLKGDW